MISRKLQTFFGLSLPERRLALAAIALTACVRLGLWLVPFRRIQYWCEHRGQAKKSGCDIGVREIVWAVRLGSRYVPRATCLTQALTAQILLARHGHAGEVHIGVALDGERGFRAHAWVEHGGEVLIGGAEKLDGYAPMLVLEGGARPGAGGSRS